MLAQLTNALPLSRALREWFPKGRTGKPVHLSTGIRWNKDGIAAPDGTRIYLTTYKVGGQTYVRREDAEHFIAALNADNPVTESPVDVSRRAKEASDALERLGC